MHTINCNQKTGVFPMSDLAATNCQNSCSSGCGCGNDFGFNNCFWLILILLCCNNGNDCGCGNDNLMAHPYSLLLWQRLRYRHKRKWLWMRLLVSPVFSNRKKRTVTYGSPFLADKIPLKFVI